MRKQIKTILSCLLVFALLAATALTVISCSGEKTDDTKKTEERKAAPESEITEETDVATEAGKTEETDAPGEAEKTASGKKFTFIVIDDEGVSETFEITSEKETVGEALLDEKLIEGEDSQYGLYVKVVNGVSADYNTDGAYWAFYIGEAYAETGVDSTPITEGETYKFVYTKA